MATDKRVITYRGKERLHYDNVRSQLHTTTRTTGRQDEFHHRANEFRHQRRIIRL